MDTNNVLGIGMPQNQSTQIKNLDSYNVNADIISKDLSFNSGNDGVEANNGHNRTPDDEFYDEIKKAFRVGEAYTNKEVKSKLRILYRHPLCPDELDEDSVKVSHLKKNYWFIYEKFENVISGKTIKGVLILDCFL